MFFSVINVSIPFSSAGTVLLPLRERVSINAMASSMLLCGRTFSCDKDSF